MQAELMRALIISDTGNARELRHLLQRTQAPSLIEAVATVQAAIEAAQARDFDAVLMDFRRPDNGGLNSVATLRAAYPQQAIIILAGSDDDDVVSQARHVGADSVVTAGQVDARSLDRWLRSEIEKKRLQLENARLADEAARANRARDEFVAMLSHELRTPLTAILGWAVLLRDGRMPPESTARALASIEQSARDQGRLIDDLLDISHIVNGKLSLNVAPMILITVIESAIESVRFAAEAKQVAIACDLDSDVPPLIGDSNRLQQVLWNLLSNAVKFTPKRGRIEVALRGVDGNTEIVVADNGIGIPPDALPHIFERFRQADSSVSRAHGGLGLGLAIVRHLVELHGGTVQAYSEGEGKGCRFALRFPVTSSEMTDLTSGRWP